MADGPVEIRHHLGTRFRPAHDEHGVVCLIMEVVRLELDETVPSADREVYRGVFYSLDALMLMVRDAMEAAGQAWPGKLAFDMIKLPANKTPVDGGGEVH